LESDLDGNSLCEVIDRRSPPRDVYSEGMLCGSTERSLSSKRFKLMYDAQGDSYRLYDVDADPLELRDISRKNPAVVDELKKRMDEIYPRLVRRYLATAAPNASDQPAPIEALRALGYIEE
jgi:arylsulfatase A-like enzyme